MILAGPASTDAGTISAAGQILKRRARAKIGSGTTWLKVKFLSRQRIISKAHAGFQPDVWDRGKA